ncbi:MAG: cytochrome b5 [Ardenticatenales bacterium]|nr:cytochrome b5 [Ardenticatenales bacterium]
MDGLNDDLPIFTRGQLARHDGDRAPAYVACGGLVYDVSASSHWPRGLHRSLHWAGQDLTAELADAPHGIESVMRMPCVGRLADAPGR